MFIGSLLRKSTGSEEHIADRIDHQCYWCCASILVILICAANCWACDQWSRKRYVQRFLIILFRSYACTDLSGGKRNNQFNLWCLSSRVLSKRPPRQAIRGCSLSQCSVLLCSNMVNPGMFVSSWWLPMAAPPGSTSTTLLDDSENGN